MVSTQLQFVTLLLALSAEVLGKRASFHQRRQDQDPSAVTITGMSATTFIASNSTPASSQSASTDSESISDPSDSTSMDPDDPLANSDSSAMDTALTVMPTTYTGPLSSPTPSSSVSMLPSSTNTQSIVTHGLPEMSDSAMASSSGTSYSWSPWTSAMTQGPASYTGPATAYASTMDCAPGSATASSSAAVYMPSGPYTSSPTSTFPVTFNPTNNNTGWESSHTVTIESQVYKLQRPNPSGLLAIPVSERRSSSHSGPSAQLQPDLSNDINPACGLSVLCSTNLTTNTSQQVDVFDVAEPFSRHLIGNASDIAQTLANFTASCPFVTRIKTFHHESARVYAPNITEVWVAGFTSEIPTSFANRCPINESTPAQSGMTTWAQKPNTAIVKALAAALQAGGQTKGKQSATVQVHVKLTDDPSDDSSSQGSLSLAVFDQDPRTMPQNCAQVDFCES